MCRFAYGPSSWCHCHSLSLAPVNPDWFYLPGFTFLVPAHPDSPGQNPWGLCFCVCACACACACVSLLFVSFWAATAICHEPWADMALQMIVAGVGRCVTISVNAVSTLSGIFIVSVIGKGWIKYHGIGSVIDTSIRCSLWQQQEKARTWT